MRRRDLFLTAVPALLHAQEKARNNGPATIRAVEMIRVEGRRKTEAGDAKGQHQVNPLHVYAEHRPAEYHERTKTAGEVKATALYLRITTNEGPEGLYGPIDLEAAIVVHQQLRPFLIGKDALAGETVWDKMFRSNRHSRSSHFMMAISAVDNALWDLRGRYYSLPGPQCGAGEDAAHRHRAEAAGLWDAEVVHAGGAGRWRGRAAEECGDGEVAARGGGAGRGPYV
jgi:hypothetical protein